MEWRFLLIVILVGIFHHTSLGRNADTEYNFKEKEALKKLRTSISQMPVTFKYQNLDFYLIHFLRRNGLDVTESLNMLQNNLKWRKNSRIDSILKEKEMMNLEKKFPIRIDGKDMDGRPILSYIFQHWDIRRYLLSGKSAQFERYQIYIIEKAAQVVYDLALQGEDVSQFNILIDLNGFNRRQHACLPCLQGISVLAQLLQSKYPNSVHQIIFINAPRSFQVIMRLLKNLLSPQAQKIIHVFGFNKAEWRKHLSKFVDDNQLSKQFGGTKPFS